LWYRYEAKRIDYYFEPRDIKFVDGKFTKEWPPGLLIKL
jgi:hypothetical protein